jgi:hypothetical protein
VLLTRLGTLHSSAGPRDALVLAGAEMLMGAFWIWRLPASLKGK